MVIAVGPADGLSLSTAETVVADGLQQVAGVSGVSTARVALPFDDALMGTARQTTDLGDDAATVQLRHDHVVIADGRVGVVLFTCEEGNTKAWVLERREGSWAIIHFHESVGVA